MSLQKSPDTPRATSKQNRPRKVSAALDPYDSPETYYGKSHASRKVAKSRTYTASEYQPAYSKLDGYKAPGRRLSADEEGSVPRKFQLDVKDTLKTLRDSEDTDNNFQITIEDRGPKTMHLGTASSAGFRRIDIRGTYVLSNLLQELTLAKKAGLSAIVLDYARLNENPVARLSRRIKELFWPNLQRQIDSANIFIVAEDLKANDRRPRIYIPRGAPEQYDYYKRIASEQPEKRLDVQWLAEDPSNEEYVRDLNEAPGLLAIEMEQKKDINGNIVMGPDGKPDLQGLPFVVPGGRFNELYGWDSYMETLGLLVDGKAELCENMVRHFCFCIRHYGKILNANRTYYLCRSQPPFLTDMALRVFDHIKDVKLDSTDFLKQAMLAAIKDYYTTWMSWPRYDPDSGLSCYRPGGKGVPPETEASHFVDVLKKYQDKHKMSFDEFVKAYNYGHVKEPELDEFFRHDRSVRESGHDTTYRLESVSADLATVDLNSCLYKYEIDIARTIRFFFNDRLEIPAEWHVSGKSTVETSSTWDRRANKRRKAMNTLMWNEEKGMFFDYNVVKKQKTIYESATTFWAMWAGAATPAQANTMVQRALPLFEEHGGLASGTQKSRDEVKLKKPNRQWDHPYGWAPQQILAWTGLLRYGFKEVAQRLAYRWIYMVTRAFVDYNGVVVEKYDVTKISAPHKVDAEYGNQGADFKGIATEGFGWVNASYVYGLQIVSEHMKRALGAVTTYETFKKMTDARSLKEAVDVVQQARVHDKNADKLPDADHVLDAARAGMAASLPHSHEDESGHKATYDVGERKEYHASG